MAMPHMPPIARSLGAIFVIAALVLAVPAAAQAPEEPATDERTPEELAAEGLDNLMRALELMLLSIPQYEMPEINERGDIIIRRKNPPQDAPEAAPEEEPQGEEPQATET